MYSHLAYNGEAVGTGDGKITLESADQITVLYYTSVFFLYVDGM